MIISDYRDPNDPMWHSAPSTADERRYNASCRWVAAAVFLVIVLAIAFGVRNEPTHIASNDVTQTTHIARPPAGAANLGTASPANPAFAPRSAPAAAPASGANPAPHGSQ